MNKKRPIVYPYIPNSVPRIKQDMLQEMDAATVEEFFQDVPKHLRLAQKLALPEPFVSEYALKRHVHAVLAKNRTAAEHLSFLGAGCYQHHVPAAAGVFAAQMRVSVENDGPVTILLDSRRQF